MYGARCPGRPGAPGDSGNWSACNGTLDLAAGTLTARFDFNPPHGFADTGLLKPNTSGGPPALSWKAAGLWLPGPALHPPKPPPPPPHGYSVAVVDRNVGPVNPPQTELIFSNPVRSISNHQSQHKF